MDSKTIVGGLAVLVVVAGGSFYGGMKYAQHSRGARFAQGGPNGAQFFAANGQRGGRFTGGNGGFVAGTIVSKDASSVTIQLGGPNASSTNDSPSTGSGQAIGSKIVLYNSSTQVGKFNTGTSDDLKVGDMVTVQGAQNSDGSVTAQMIQIRPTGMGSGTFR
jgi:hypothetical protein